jgi:hypothetical protein
LRRSSDANATTSPTELTPLDPADRKSPEIVPLEVIVVPEKVPPVKAAPVNPVEAAIVVPVIVVPRKVPPVKAAPVNPVVAAIVVAVIVDPWNVPPVKAAPVNPVEAVIVVPLIVVPRKVPPVKAAPVNPVEAVIVDPWKVPPVNAAPVNPVEAVMVVPLTVDPANVPPLKAAPVNPVEAANVVPAKVPPVKEAPVNPVLAVIVVPLTVDPAKVPPTNEDPLNAVPVNVGAVTVPLNVRPLTKVLIPVPDTKTFPVTTKSPKLVTVGILKEYSHYYSMRKVLIATPTYTGDVNMKYTIALLNTMRQAMLRGFDLQVCYTAGDALVQKSRNYLLTCALNNGCDDLIFIDDDIEWDPEWIFKMLDYPVDVVGGVYRKKIDDAEVYAVRLVEPIQGDSRTGLMKVEGLATGFLRLSRKAFVSLWASSEPYTNGMVKNERMVFDLQIENQILFSEDYVMSNKLSKLGFELWIDPRMCCVHTGPKPFVGHFIKWLEDSGRFQK